MNDMLWVPDALRDAGVNVKVLPGWNEPHLLKNSDGDVVPYLWREPNNAAAGHMWHHTASNGYNPNRIKASGYAGLGMWEHDRLYASGGGEPFYVVANAFPAPISSGLGVKSLLDDFVKKDIQFLGYQSAPDGPYGWAGNTHYWNTEVVLDGVGSWIDDAVWEMMVVVASVMCKRALWSENRNVGHGQHTTRKPDPRDGRFMDMGMTMKRLVEDTKALMEEDMFTHYRVGDVRAEWEPEVFRIFELLGGTINANANSSQVISHMPWKVDSPLGVAAVRYVQEEDLRAIAGFIGLNSAKTDDMVRDGLYRYGKELASLREKAYR